MYKTGFLKVKTQILETIFAELPQTAKKVRLTIKFDDEEKLNTFKKLEAERKQIEEDVASLNSDEDSEEDNESVSESSQMKEDASQKGKLDKQEHSKVGNDKLWKHKIDIGLEEGIIYKQFYEKQFSRIGEGYKVKIKIRAQKITFEGYEIEDVEDAMVEVNELRQHIEVEYIPKYGLEMSESEMIRRRLQKFGVKIFRILDKYYRWYEISPKMSTQLQKARRKDIKTLFSEIDKSNHCLQYLYSIEQDIDTFKGSLNNEFLKLRLRFMNYKPLLEHLKGRIFVNEIMSRINGEALQDELEAELSTSKDAVVFHSVAKELLEMTIKQVRVQFQSYEYFYITIDSDQPIQRAIDLLQSYEYQAIMELSKNKSLVGEIQQVKQINYIHFITNYDQVKQNIQKKVNDPTFYGDHIPKENVIFCIGFKKKYPEHKLDYLSEILSKLLEVWKGSSFRFSIFLDQQEQIEDNKITYDYNQNEKLFSISANENTVETNIFILKNYIIKKKLQSIRNQQLKLENQETNITISTINQSQIIQDSTYLHEKSSMTLDANASMFDGQNSQNPQNLNVTSQFKDQDEKTVNFLKEYSVFLAETSKQYNEKYKESDTKVNEILSTDKRNRSLEEQLAKASGIFLFTLDSRFQVLKIKLNQTHKVDSFYEDPKRDEIVSVFVSNRVSPFIKPKQFGLKIEEEFNDTFPIRLLTLKEPITESGYLINIKKKNIQIHGKSFKVKYGTEFQVAKAVTYLKKI